LECKHGNDDCRKNSAHDSAQQIKSSFKNDAVGESGGVATSVALGTPAVISQSTLSKSLFAISFRVSAN
jgi:hypothetical protein